MAGSFTEYLAAEARSDVKHEYLDGDVWAMAGGTLEHARLASEFTRLVGNALQGRPCRVFSSDARVRVRGVDRVTYPDLSIICGRIETDPDDADTLLNPTVLVEVLSDGTEAADRGEKFHHYRRLASLREYVLVSQKHALVEVARRTDDGSWLLNEYGPGTKAVLASLDVTIDVDALYRDALRTPAAS
ncbi:MAG: Uma2 family endonuclease [Archangium sp.]|nr:Uma2 family endonuclease [Archangium sp.]